MNSTLEAKYNEAKQPFNTYKSSHLSLEAITPYIPDDEEVLRVVKGSRLAARGQVSSQAFVVMVLTNKSLHVLGKPTALFDKVKQSEVYNFAMITGVTRAKKMMLGWAIEISRASNVDTYVQMEEGDSEAFYNILRDLVAEAQKGGGGTTTVINQVDPMDQLKKLKDLLDAGILSQEEFEEKKKALLDKI
ncbi:MAG: hypothetical protein RIS26_923 [Actinomycetota bacterium]